MIAQHLEKRKGVRQKYESFIVIEVMYTGDIELAKMINYCENGLYFESDMALVPGTKILLTIGDSPYARQVKRESYMAKILWGKVLQKSIYSFGYGVKYLLNENEHDSSKIDLKEKKDFRKHPRRHFGKQTFFRYQNIFFPGTINNISRGGCFIETSESFILNQVISFSFNLSEKKQFKKIRIKAQVVHLSPDGIGVKFKGISKKKRN